MPRLGRSAFLKRETRWSNGATVDRRKSEGRREAEERRQEAARRAARGSV